MGQIATNLEDLIEPIIIKPPHLAHINLHKPLPTILHPFPALPLILAPNNHPIQIPNVQVENDETFVVGLGGGVAGGGKQVEGRLVGQGGGGGGLLQQAGWDGLEVEADGDVGREGVDVVFCGAEQAAGLFYLLLQHHAHPL